MIDADRTFTDGTILSRRLLLATGVLAGALALPGATAVADMAVGTVPVGYGAAAGDGFAQFMAASGHLIQHHLAPAIGERMFTLLRAAVPSFDDDVGRIVATARRTGAERVEEFFDQLPAGSPVETAHRIIFAWYAGVIDPSTDAQAFAFEDALMYQPTRDVTALATYSLNGPDNWTDLDPPLSPMPSF